MPASPESHSRQSLRRWTLAVALGAVLVAIGALLLVRSTGDAAPAASQVGLVRVYAAIEAGEVVDATIDDGARTVTVTLADGSTMRSAYPQMGAEPIVDRLAAAGVEETEVVVPARDSRLTELLMTLIPVSLILIVMIVLVRRVGSGQLSGFSDRSDPVDVPDVRFGDVIGVEEAVADLDEVVQFLRDPSRFSDVGARVPKGVLLVGPPGTGKTLLAKAVAAEAGVPFFSVTGSDFVEIFAGMGQRRVKALFKAARRHGRAVVFIDEIDAVGKARTGGGPRTGATDEQESTLNALLTEMDGFAESEIVVLAATNRPDVLDPALTRPGRFDRSVHVPLPDRGGRTALFRFYLGDVALDPDVDVDAVADRLARRSIGMSGASVENTINEAKLLAAKAGVTSVSGEMLERALERVAMGRERRSAVMTDDERRIVAYHEAGHAVCAMLAPGVDDPMHVSIVPRGGAGGVTWLDPGEAEHFVTRSRLLASLTVAMGGRAAEKVILDGDYTQGAAGDIDAATRRVTQMVCEYGMSELGPIAIDPAQVMGEDAVRVRRVVTTMIEDAAARADALVGEHWTLVRAVAEALLEHEDLTREQLRGIAGAVTTAR